jgi:hypothetical protein
MATVQQADFESRSAHTGKGQRNVGTFLTMALGVTDLSLSRRSLTLRSRI